MCTEKIFRRRVNLCLSERIKNAKREVKKEDWLVNLPLCAIEQIAKTVDESH